MNGKSKAFWILFASAIIGLASFWYLDDLKILYNDTIENIPQARDLAEFREKAGKELFTPPPLELPEGEQASDVNLTADGVVNWTNTQRKQHGLEILTIDRDLTEAARTKAEDMFGRQYFAHVAPDGIDAADLVDRAGYDYLLVGENLALGNYEDDEHLVQAWMNSPGHRENILREKYEEIGVAVVKGVYQGKSIWMAVQIFARPSSSCPLPNSVIKIQTEENEEQIKTLKQRLTQLEQEIEQTDKNNRQEYNQLVEEYNSTASLYNELVKTTKDLVNRYNRQINEYNICVE